MNVSAMAILPFLAAVECHVLADYFADPVGCAADVPVSRDYRRAFQEKNLVFPTYERVSKIFENGFPAAPYGDGNEETIGIDCGGDETWARRSLDCLGKLKNEMNLVIDKLVSQTAEKFESAMDEYILESLVFLQVYEKYVSEVPGGRTPGWLEVPFRYLMFEKPQANVHCALRFLFDGGYAKIDEIYRKYVFFADDHGDKMSKSPAELKSLVLALTAAKRPEYERGISLGIAQAVKSTLNTDKVKNFKIVPSEWTSPEADITSRRGAELPQSPVNVSAISGAEQSKNKNKLVSGPSTGSYDYSPSSDESEITRTVRKVFRNLMSSLENKYTETDEMLMFYEYKLSLQESILTGVEYALVRFSKPFSDKTDTRSPSALSWSFLKRWEHYDDGLFMNKSLAEHEAILGGKPISLKTVIENVEFDEPLDELMATNELVPFILHNYIANTAVCFIAFAVVANDRLIDFVSVEKPEILANSPPKSSGYLVKQEHDYYRYFDRLITVFKITYQYYCDVMKHDSATVVRLLDFTSKLFSSEENEPKNLETNITALKNMLKSWFNWSQTRVDNIDGWKISIKDLVGVVEVINFGLLSLTELIKNSKVDI